MNTMGEVLATFRIMPESIEVDLSALEHTITAAIKDMARIEGLFQKPVAFGLKSIELSIVIGDGEGGTDKIEETIQALNGVQTVISTGVGLL